MSSWVENQQQEAFLLYRRYIGVGLHFKEGSSYDYTMYSGGTKLTLKAFLQKPKMEVAKFMQLKNKLRGVSVEEFLFAHARHGDLNINSLLSNNAMIFYKNWQALYGDKEAFHTHVSSQLRRIIQLNHWGPGMEMADAAEQILAIGEDRHVELLCWILQENPAIVTRVRTFAEQNIFQKMMLQKVTKAQKFYSYLCII